MQQTTIKISKNLANALKKIKANKESYEEFLWDLIEPYLDYSEETKKEMEKSLEEYKRGEVFSFEEVTKELV